MHQNRSLSTLLTQFDHFQKRVFGRLISWHLLRCCPRVVKAPFLKANLKAVSKSGQMVLKELKGTYFDAYIWQTMWKHAKKSMEELKLPDSVFLQGDGRSSGLKTLKTAKTMKTKTPGSQNFQILWPTQGGTMWKGMARAFRKCVTYGGRVVLIHSYEPSKSVQISIIFSVERRCQKKITLVQFWDLRSVTNRSFGQWGC